MQAANGEDDAPAHGVQVITGLCTGRLPEAEAPLDAANTAIGRGLPLSAGRPCRPCRRTRTAGLPMREDAFGPPRIKASA